MSMKIIHLNKLLKSFELPENELISLLREDIRQDLARENNHSSGGGNFYLPFWSDVKKHVAGLGNLEEATAFRIKANRGRRRLYPPLTIGFLNWWYNKRRWKNEPVNFTPLSVKARYPIDELNTIVKIENLLGLSYSELDCKLIYPYLYEEPALSENNFRLGLWALSTALSEYSTDSFRILDVHRSKSFSITDLPFDGNERSEFLYHFSRVIDMWEKLKKEYYV